MMEGKNHPVYCPLTPTGTVVCAWPCTPTYISTLRKSKKKNQFQNEEMIMKPFMLSDACVLMAMYFYKTMY